MNQFKLAIFDMAGTTVRDEREVESCIYEAALITGLQTTWSRVHEMNGIAKKLVFETLWKEAIGKEHPDYLAKVEESYATFREILEEHYLTQPVLPTEGAIETINWLRSKGVKIALNTGFYREVANIILGRLGWDQGLDERYMGSEGSFIDLSVTPSETGGKGRPHPDMIHYAMKMLDVERPVEVIKIGDAPVDILEGKSAGCLLTLGLTNGCHSRGELEAVIPDGLLDSLHELRSFLETRAMI